MPVTVSCVPGTRAIALLALLLVLPLVNGCGAAPGEQPPAVHTPAPAAPPTTTILVVRHAERESEEDRDSPLSETGRARARALADALDASGVQAIYVTQYQRTRQTAEPLASRLRLQVRPDTTPGGTTPARELARRVLERHAGETVLIVGHSNTVPAVVHALGGTEMPELESSRYGDLFVVTVPGSGPVRTMRLQFGMATAIPRAGS